MRVNIALKSSLSSLAYLNTREKKQNPTNSIVNNQWFLYSYPDSYKVGFWVLYWSVIIFPFNLWKFSLRSG